MKSRILLLLATTLALPAPDVARAQRLSGDLTPGRRYASAFFEGSWAKPIGPAFSSIPTQPYFMVVGRAEYVLESHGPFALAFYMEAIPAIVVDRVPRYHYATLWKPPEGPMVREKV